MPSSSRSSGRASVTHSRAVSTPPVRSVHPIDPSGSLEPARPPRSAVVVLDIGRVYGPAGPAGPRSWGGSRWLPYGGPVGSETLAPWQHPTEFVANTRWWPPCCMAVDFVVATVIVVEIAADLHFR
jgi:hypothetical protein